MDENGVKRYDKQVLGCLLDKYENSLLHMEKNQVQIRIVYPVKKSTLPESFDFLLWLRTRLSEGESIRKYSLWISRKNLPASVSWSGAY